MDIFFQSDLMKFSFQFTHSHLFSNKFCVISKKEFKYYKSKESFIRLENPITVVPLKNILSCNYIINDMNSKNKKDNLHLFMVNLKDSSNGTINIDVFLKKNLFLIYLINTKINAYMKKRQVGLNPSKFH